jgi:hypothetical protein
MEKPLEPWMIQMDQTMATLAVVPGLLTAGEFRLLDQHGMCDTGDPNAHTLSEIIGYVVRMTVVNFEMLEARNGKVGYDIAVIPGNRYADAVRISREAREAQTGNWALIDNLYACGHRGA